MNGGLVGRSAALCRGKIHPICTAHLAHSIVSGMSIDSRPGKLPLGEAMIQWSDPVFVDDIRRAEDLVPTDAFTILYRFTIEDVVKRRRKPHHRFPTADVGPIRVLDLAWDRLIDCFRLMIEQGTIELEGTAARSMGSAGRERLPRDLAASFDIDPASGAVFIRNQTYLGVTASRATEVADTGGELLPPKLKRKRGRPAFPSTEFAEIANDRQRADNNKVEATFLLTEFKRRYPFRKQPTFRTVIDHVDDIYTKSAVAGLR